MSQKQQDILWGERVPGAPYPMTVAELAQLPDDNWPYELVEGRLIRMPGSGSEATRIAMLLGYFLLSFVLPRQLGDVTGPDGTFDLTQPGDTTETALIPDVAFVSAGRLPPLGTPAARAYPRLVPDLVAEVVSPSQYHPEMNSKAKFYLECGVRLVWILWPEAREVEVWRPSTLDAPTTILDATASLDGLDVLPGFTCPVADLLK